MRVRVRIHPEFEHLRNDILKVVNGDYVADKVYCHRRNVVEKIAMQGNDYVVKIYKRPNFVNRIAYTYMRKSKARRAYEYAGRLLQSGVDTPRPVAYVEVMKGGLFSTGYFFAEYMPHELMSNAYNGAVPDCEKARLSKDFVDFTFSLHAKGILPLDFNSSNIFYHLDESDGHYKFALTDINRMRFGKVPSTSAVMRSFEQFGVQVDGLYKLAVYYCVATKADVEYSIFIFLFHRIRSRIKRALKLKAKEKFNRA